MTTPSVGRIVLSEHDVTRFITKLDAPNEDGCRLWNRSLDANGYGQFHLAGRTVKSHLVAWALECGPFPPGLEPDHTCNVRSCTTTEHLEWVTHQENNRRIAERSTHCRSGEHAWADPGVAIVRPVGRECRPCRLARRRLRYAETGRT
jgi:hypothetical protein